MNVLNSFLYPTCVNCRIVIAVVSLKSSFLFLSIFCGELMSGKASGLKNDNMWSNGV